MKRYIFICMMALAAIGFTSCNTNEPCHFNKQTIDLVVNQDNWVFDDNTGQYYCHFDVAELTADVYNYGEISISREYNSGTKDAYQVALPMSSYMSEEVTNADGTTKTVYYTQHIDYRVGIGYVEVQLTNSDYVYSTEKPEAMLFRMQMTY